MNRKALVWLGVTSVVGLLLVGVPYFRTSYQDTDVTSLIGVGLPVVIVLTALSVGVGDVEPVPAGLVAFGVPLNVVIARIFIDVAADPTSHNLWPLEIVLAGVLSLGVALAGVFAGLGIRVIARRR